MTLLIVEDLPGEAENLRQAALATGLVTTVRVAHDIRSAMDIIRLELPDVVGGSRPLVVLLDHDLPEVAGGPETGSGADVAKAVLRLDTRVPIIGISAVESNNVHLETCGAFLSVEKREAGHVMSNLLRSCMTWYRAMECGRNPNLPIY